MAAKEMYDYLSEVTADYTTIELELSSTARLPETVEKEQYLHKFSDGQRGIVTMSSTSHFQVAVQFDNLLPSDEGLIKDMYIDENKANGLARSFYWHHPSDGHVYTVKFLGPLTSEREFRAYGMISVKQIQLDVLGVKPSA